MLKRRFGEHDETDLAREIESFERDISSTSSSPVISSVMSSSTNCVCVCVWRMAHQGLKQHIDLSISRLSTYKALRDEIITYSRARRTWTDPNALQVDAVHVNGSQERQVDGSGSRSDKGKGGKGGKGKSKKGGKGKERGEKAATKFDGECRYCQKRGHKKSDCRKMKSDIAAGKCDIVASQLGSMHSQRQAQRSLLRKRAMHRAWQAPSRCNRWCQCTSHVPTAVRRLNRLRRGTST